MAKEISNNLNVPIDKGINMDKLGSINHKENFGIQKSSTRGKKKYSFFINDNIQNLAYDFDDNQIDSSKYNLITYIPKSLLFQFSRMANIYFLMIAVLQLIPIISPLNPMTAVAPLCFVLFVSMLREGIEDLERHKYDNQLNSEPTIVYRDGDWREVVSKDIKMGEIVMVKRDNSFPADMIILDSNLKIGICYVETASLDGEKTLKMKFPAKTTANKFKEGETFRSHINIAGFCNCELPDSDLYSFNGCSEIKIDNLTETSSLDNKNLLLKGSFLRNTEWIIGYVVYTGHNTKIILNSKKPKQKVSMVETKMSRYMIAVLGFQIVLCLICAIFNQQFYQNNLVNAWYLSFDAKWDVNSSAAISYFTYMLLLNTLIPISLIITLEIIKIIQGYFMSCDVLLYSKIRDR